ncbi:MAG: hypothetical protein GF401_20415 [Chitinivibrionales bacterium]|nr:hypothetical protein [Chitinivibrionales bacterium]
MSRKCVGKESAFIAPRRGRRLYAILATLFMVTHSMMADSFDCSLDGGGGYATDVFDVTDGTFSNSPFISFSLNPSYEHELKNNRQIDITAGFSGSKYFERYNEYDCESAFSFITPLNEKHRLSSGIGGGYYFQPGGQDADPLINYFMAGTRIEYTRSFKHPLTITCTIDYLNDIDTSRWDIKNRVWAKIQFLSNYYVMPHIKSGISWSISSNDDYAYVEFLFSSGVTATLKEKNTFLGLMYLSFKFFGDEIENTAADTLFPGNSGKNLNNEIYRASHTQLFYLGLSYFRKITQRTDLYVAYDWGVYASGSEETGFSSHRLSAGIDWHLEKL